MESHSESKGGSLTTTSSRFWGVSWDRGRKKWLAYYKDADGKHRHIGYFEDEEEAARARNKAIRDAGLEGRRKTNAVDATGALVPRVTPHTSKPRDRSAVVAPQPRMMLGEPAPPFFLCIEPGFIILPAEEGSCRSRVSI